MFVRLQPLIKWPGREELMKTMPLSFKAHLKKCVVIIDCFEVFCERPKALKARAQTWSQYKHHNMVKDHTSRGDFIYIQRMGRPSLRSAHY